MIILFLLTGTFCFVIGMRWYTPGTWKGIAKEKDSLLRKLLIVGAIVMYVNAAIRLI